MQVHPYPLEVLHGVGLPIFQEFLALIRERIAIDRHPTMFLPVRQEPPLNTMAGLRETGVRCGIGACANQPLSIKTNATAMLLTRRPIAASFAPIQARMCLPTLPFTTPPGGNSCAVRTACRPAVRARPIGSPPRQRCPGRSLPPAPPQSSGRSPGRGAAGGRRRRQPDRAGRSG